MRYRIILTLALALSPAVLFAEQDTPLATDPGDPFAPPAGPTEAQQLETRCESLQKQMRELKNRPLRRSALQDRYKLECQDAPYGGD